MKKREMTPASIVSAHGGEKAISALLVGLRSIPYQHKKGVQVIARETVLLMAEKLLTDTKAFIEHEQNKEKRRLVVLPAATPQETEDTP